MCFRKLGSPNLLRLRQMTARSVLLAMAAASFLRGDEPFTTHSDGRTGGTDTSGLGGEGTSLSQRWRECDKQAQLSLASANPQVEKQLHL